MIRKLIPVLMLITALLTSSALAAAYTPGETAMQLFLDALSAGRIVKSDIQVSLSGDPAAMGLDEEEAAAFSAVTAALNNATLTVGAGKIEDGIRLELGAAYAAEAPVAVDAALNITLTGLQAESSLMPGESISARWETLLALAGMDDEEIQMILAARDADIEELAAQLIETAAPYVEMASNALAPYGQTIAAFISTLPAEIKANVPSDGKYPAAAQELTLPITAKDVGTLLTQLADQLENDAMLSMLITAALAEQSDLPFTSAAELCAAVKEGAAAMTDTSMPLVIRIGVNENSMPLYACFSLTSEGNGSALLSVIHNPGAVSGSGVLTVEMLMADAQGNASDGLIFTTAYAVDSADENIHDINAKFDVLVSAQPIVALEAAFSSSAVTTADGQPGYDGKQMFSMSVSDETEPVSMVLTSSTASALTADGGETAQVVGTVDIFADGVSVPVTFANELAVAPGADGPTGVYTENGSMPSLGITSFNETYTLYTKVYDPAATAALSLTQLETASVETMEAFIGRLTASAEALANDLIAKLPPEVVQLIAEL